MRLVCRLEPLACCYGRIPEPNFAQRVAYLDLPAHASFVQARLSAPPSLPPQEPTWAERAADFPERLSRSYSAASQSSRERHFRRVPELSTETEDPADSYAGMRRRSVSSRLD